MTHVTDEERICPLCGKTIQYQIIEEDGMDWEGHHRGHYESRTVGYDCDCNGKNLKKMCLNCVHRGYVGKTCESKELIEEIQGRLKEPSFISLPDIDQLVLKEETNSCKYWEINPKIAETVFK